MTTKNQKNAAICSIGTNWAQIFKNHDAYLGRSALLKQGPADAGNRFIIADKSWQVGFVLARHNLMLLKLKSKNKIKLRERNRGILLQEPHKRTDNISCEVWILLEKISRESIMIFFNINYSNKPLRHVLLFLLARKTIIFASNNNNWRKTKIRHTCWPLAKTDKSR